MKTLALMFGLIVIFAFCAKDAFSMFEVCAEEYQDVCRGGTSEKIEDLLDCMELELQTASEYPDWECEYEWIDWIYAMQEIAYKACNEDCDCDSEPCENTYDCTSNQDARLAAYEAAYCYLHWSYCNPVPCSW